MELCSICLSHSASVQSVKCNADHFLCSECISGWVSSLTIPALKGKCSLKRIRCPRFENDGCISSLSTAILCESGLEQVEKSVTLSKINEAVKFLLEDLMDVLSIRCPRPTCRALLDQNPDACAAVSCGTCGQNFCGCCYARFATSQQTHLHVPLAHQWRDVFLPRPTIEEGQHSIRLIQLHSFLDTLKCPEIIEDILEQAGEELADLGLPVRWEDLTEQALAAQVIIDQQHSGVSITDVGVNVIHEVPEEEEEVVEDAEAVARRHGQRIINLCFQQQFTELQYLSAEYRQQNIEYAIDWFQRSIDGNLPFHCAARLNDTFHSLAAMQLLVELGAAISINEHDCDGLSPLHRFVMLNDISRVKFILSQTETNVDVQSAEGRTALYVSAELRHVHIARELLRCGAYLHTTCSTGTTVLMAVSLRCLRDKVTGGELVRSLQFWLEAGADLEAADGQSAWRALHYAAAGRYDPGTVAVRTFLRAGANIAVRTRFEQTPLMLAVCFGNLEAIPLLVEAEGEHPSIPASFEAETLLLNEHIAPQRDKIVKVLRKAQYWQVRRSRVKNWMKNHIGALAVGAAISVVLCAVVIHRFW